MSESGTRSVCKAPHAIAVVVRISTKVFSFQNCFTRKDVIGHSSWILGVPPTATEAFCDRNVPQKIASFFRQQTIRPLILKKIHNMHLKVNDTAVPSPHRPFPNFFPIHVLTKWVVLVILFTIVIFICN